MKTTKLISATIITLFFLQCAKQQKSAVTGIDPPLRDISNPIRELTVDPSKDTTLVMETGSRIHVPANAFLDKDGNEITTPVVLEYEEMNTAAEAVISGVPMTIQMGDKTEVFQSAGMFRLRGKCNGSYDVRIREGKGLSVDVASNKQDGNFANYYFDEASNNWTEIASGGSPKQNDVQEVMETLKPCVLTENLSEVREPVKVDVYQNGMEVFELDLDYSSIPELSPFETLMWKHDASSGTKNPLKNKWIFKTNWSEATVSPEGGSIKLVLREGAKSFATVIKPVVHGKKAKEALARYTEALEDYKKAEEKKAKALAEKKRMNERIGRFYRTVSVNDWGVYNCDRYYNNPNTVFLADNYQLGGKELPKGTRLYHFSKEDGLYYDATNYRIKFNPEVDNSLVAFLPDEKMAVVGSEQFAEIPILSDETSKDFTIEFEEQEVPQDEQALSTLLQNL